MGFEAAQYRNGDTGRYQWAVYSKSSGCWYFANRPGKRAAEALARKYNSALKES